MHDSAAQPLGIHASWARGLTRTDDCSHDRSVSASKFTPLLPLVMAAGLGCGDDDSPTPPAATSGATEDSTGNADPSTSSTSNTEEATGTPSTTSQSSGPPPATSAADNSTGDMPEGSCTPDGLFFNPQASISFDFSGQTCTMDTAPGSDPQLVFDLRDTGLTDIAAHGISMSSATTGTFVNPQNVVGISPDVPTTIQATNDADGSPVTLLFVIETNGPFLDAEVTFDG